MSLRGAIATKQSREYRSRFASLAMTTIFIISFFLLFSSCGFKSFDEAFKNAESKVSLGKRDSALAAYRSIVKKFPDDPRLPGVLIKIADYYATVIGDERMATEWYGRVIKDYPYSEAGRLALEKRALLREELGEMEGAIEDYSTLVKYYPEHAGVYRYQLMLASDYLSIKDYAQARIEALPIVKNKRTPKDIREQALFVVAESYFLEGKPKEAAPFYQQMLIEFPKSKLVSEAELHLASCVEEMGYLGTAQAMTKEAGTDYPNRKVIEARLKSIDGRTKNVYKPK